VGILIWTVIGLGVGALANWMLPATNPQGMMLTILLGLLGGIAGGLLGATFINGSVAVFSVESLLFSGGGALILLLGFQLSKSVFYLEH